MNEVSINGERWIVVWPLGVHHVNKTSFYGMLLGRKMPGTVFGLQFRTKVFHWVHRLLLTGAVK